VRTPSIVISVVFHAALLLLAPYARPFAPPARAPSRVEVAVLDAPRARAVTRARTESLPAPSPLRHAPARTRASEPPVPVPSKKTPLATGVQMGNEPAVRGAEATVPLRQSSPPPPVQKDLSAKKSSRADETCTEPPTKPVPRSKPSLIEYTPKARADGIEGRLLLRVSVGANGQVDDVAIENGVEPTLDEAAIASVRTWTFTPALRCGKPVGGSYTVARRFELGD
jgi:protein TonB